jgi:hypothetical protein
MEIRSDHQESWVTIRLTEVETEHYPSAECEVEASLEGFRVGRVVWIEADVLRVFASDLDSLYQSRSGSAELVAMGPQEFRLLFKSADKLGHVSATVMIAMSTLTLQWNVTCTFPVDPTLLPTYVKEFLGMLKEMGPA